MSELRFGYSDICINPPDTMGLAGFKYRNDLGFNNSGILDDIYARALSIKSDGLQLVVITLDICLMSRETADMIRKEAARNLKIPMDNIMLSLSHTHSGPLVIKEHSDNTDEIRKRIDNYIKNLIEKIVAICLAASSTEFKARLYGSTFKSYMGYNRRYVTEKKEKSSKVKMLFNLWTNPEHNTNGIVDPDIPVLLLERVDEPSYDPYFSQAGVDRIVIFNVPSHPVVMSKNNRYVSADYPGAARKCIEETLGNGTKAMFLLGACGNVNTLLACQNNPKAIEVIGKAIGFGICAALSLRKEIEFNGLKVISETIKLEEGAPAKEVITQVFKIGNAAIAAVSNECFTELGLNIRNASPYEQTLIATNSNGGHGYIPTREVLLNSDGYEVESSKKSGFNESLLDNMIVTVSNNLKKLF